MIDPLEVAIVYVQGQLAAQVGTRVASKHRFNHGWTLGQSAIVMRLDGGDPDLYSPLYRVRFEVNIYSADTVDIVSLWAALVAVSRSANREVVTTDNGDGLLQNFIQASELSVLYDEELSQDYGMAFFEAMIGEEAVST